MTPVGTRRQHTRRTEIVRRHIAMTLPRESLAPVLDRMCRAHGLVDEGGCPRVAEAIRLMTTLQIVRLAGHPAREAAAFAASSARLMMVCSMGRRIARRYATSADVRKQNQPKNGCAILHGNCTVVMDDWLLKHLCELAPSYTDRKGQVQDTKMIRDLLERSARDAQLDEVFREYVRRVTPMRARLAAVEDEVARIVREAAKGAEIQ